MVFMELRGIGNAVLHYREKKGLSQMQVAEGICNEMTMSRIEIGKREFDMLLSETLLQRLGKTVERFEFLLNDEDYKLYLLREKIMDSYKHDALEKAKMYIEQYKKVIPDTHILHEQFLLFYEALIMKAEKKKTDKEVIEMLYRAVNFTRSDFKEMTSKIRLYSVIEIKIIYELFLLGECSYEEISSVLRFVEEMYDEEEKGSTILPFLYHAAKEHENQKNWYQLEKVTNQAIGFLHKGRIYIYLLEFYFMEMEAEYFLYRENLDWNQKRMDLIQRCNEIYYMSMMLEECDMMQKSEKFCEEKLECQITK